MTTSSRIRECIDFLNQAYFDLAMTPKKASYHWNIKGQIADKMFELDGLLDDVDHYEIAYARENTRRVAAIPQEQAHTPPAG